jgi:hypothetical protein
MQRIALELSCGTNVQGLNNAGIDGGNDVHASVQVCLRNTGCPCVRKASLYSRLTVAYKGNGQSNKDLLALAQVSYRMRIPIKLAEIRALTHGFLLGSPSQRQGRAAPEGLVTAWWLKLWCLYLRLCTGMGCTVVRNQGMGCDHRSPDDPSRPGLKDILMPCLDLKAQGLMLLASVLGAVSRVGQVQDMRARGDLYVSYPQTRIKGLIVERYEAYRLWQDEARVGLRTMGLFGVGEATQQPAGPSKEQYKPTKCSSHGDRPMSIFGSSGIVCRTYGVFPVSRRRYQ